MAVAQPEVKLFGRWTFEDIEVAILLHPILLSFPLFRLFRVYGFHDKRIHSRFSPFGMECRSFY
jgi:hypothetical protein